LFQLAINRRVVKKLPIPGDHWRGPPIDEKRLTSALVEKLTIENPLFRKEATI
jgi:hypothetical protein